MSVIQVDLFHNLCKIESLTVIFITNIEGENYHHHFRVMGVKSDSDLVIVMIVVLLVKKVMMMIVMYT